MDHNRAHDVLVGPFRESLDDPATYAAVAALNYGAAPGIIAAHVTPDSAFDPAVREQIFRTSYAIHRVDEDGATARDLIAFLGTVPRGLSGAL